MKKRIFAVIGIMMIAVMLFTACSAGKGEEAANGTTDVGETVSVSEESTAELVTEETTESTTETTTAGTTQSTTKTQTTTKQNTTAKQTTTKKVTTTKKQTTTQKQTTTTKPTTTVKNVSAKDVQAQVNSYIKSKGVKVDTSMTPSNASWYPPVYASQSNLNNGYCLRSGKEWVDLIINDIGVDNTYMYCYYSSSEESLYILYL